MLKRNLGLPLITLAAVLLALARATALTAEQRPDSIAIETPAYRLVMARDSGYAPVRVSDLRAKRDQAQAELREFLQSHREQGG